MEKRNYKSPKKNQTRNESFHKKIRREKKEDVVKKIVKTGETVSENKKKQTQPSSNGIRINRYIATAGICSRREADKYIQAGVVSVNGKIVTELGIKIKQTDVVKFNGSTIRAERKVYILINKPKDVVSTVDDAHAERTVIDLIRGACPERVYPVGRLDKATTGVLLLTNDGDLTKKLTHPKHNRKKIYHVFLNKAVTKNHLHELTEGLELEDGRAWADVASYVDNDKTQVGVEIHSGKNRIIRRMFEYLGYKVKKLDRVYFAGLTKKDVPRGKWRFLSEKEVTQLRMGAF